MAKLADLKQSEQFQQRGRWFSWWEDIRLLIRPIENEDYQKLLRDLQEPHQQMLQAAPESDGAREMTKEVVRKATATHVLVGWENIEGDDGEPLEYSAELAAQLFLDPGYVHLYRFVLQTAQNERAFLARQQKADEGN